VVPPRIELAFPDPGLANVIENEDLLRMAVYELNGWGKLPGKNQDVADQLGRFRAAIPRLKSARSMYWSSGSSGMTWRSPFELRSIPELFEAGRKIIVR
jgi:hypothetical protein